MTTTIRTVAVAGAGTMGAGIALVAARAGFRTIVYDTRDDALARARTQTESFFAKSVERKRMTAEQSVAALAAMSGTTDLADLAEADIVIEAVFEELTVKHRLFAALDKVCPAATMFASNTSTLSITEIAGGSAQYGGHAEDDVRRICQTGIGGKEDGKESGARCFHVD